MLGMIISRADSTQGPELKVRVSVAIFKKKHFHHSNAYIYW